MKKLLLVFLIGILLGSGAWASQSGGISTYLGDLQWIRRDGTNYPSADILWAFNDLSDVDTINAWV